MQALRTAVLTAIVGALLWCGWVFLQRYNARHAWEAEERERKRAANAQAEERFNRVYGGSEVKILNFYAATGTAAAGRPRLLCYGVLNASELRMDPPVAGIYPTLSKCVEVRPERATRYTLTAVDAAGHSVSASLALEVKGQARGKAAAEADGR